MQGATIVFVDAHINVQPYWTIPLAYELGLVARHKSCGDVTLRATMQMCLTTGSFVGILRGSRTQDYNNLVSN
jgi:hypothetical protein